MWDLGNVGLGSVAEDVVSWFDDMTLFDDMGGALENFKTPLQSLWSADEDAAAMEAEEQDDDHEEY
jgi:hypothetical protein